MAGGLGVSITSVLDSYDEDCLSLWSVFIFVVDHSIGAGTKAEIARFALDRLNIQCIRMRVVGQELELYRDRFLDIIAETFEVVASAPFEFKNIQSAYSPNSLNTCSAGIVGSSARSLIIWRSTASSSHSSLG